MTVSMFTTICLQWPPCNCDSLLHDENKCTGLTVCLNGSRDVLAEALVHVEHVKVNPSQLDNKGVSHCLAGPDIGLKNAAQLFDGFWVLQDVHVLMDGRGAEEPLTNSLCVSEMWINSDTPSYLGGLLDDTVPHLIGQQHIFLYQVLLNSLVGLCPDHVPYCLIKCVDLYVHTNKQNSQHRHSTGQIRDSCASLWWSSVGKNT